MAVSVIVVNRQAGQIIGVGGGMTPPGVPMNMLNLSTSYFRFRDRDSTFSSDKGLICLWIKVAHNSKGDIRIRGGGKAEHDSQNRKDEN